MSFRVVTALFVSDSVLMQLAVIENMKICKARVVVGVKERVRMTVRLLMMMMMIMHEEKISNGGGEGRIVGVLLLLYFIVF